MTPPIFEPDQFRDAAKMVSHPEHPDEQMIEPCPFCGETELRVAFSHEAGRWDIWEVECETCCVSKDGELGHVGDEARQSAITCWNQRAAHSVMAGKVAELSDENAKLRTRLSHVAQIIQSSGGDEELITMAYREASGVE